MKPMLAASEKEKSDLACEARHPKSHGSMKKGRSRGIVDPRFALRLMNGVIWLLAVEISIAGISYETLKKGFISPPPSARPLVWWHWVNGNITEQGIEDDLKWMGRIGIGGVQNFDVALGSAGEGDRRLPFMSKQWGDQFRYAIKLADSLRFEYAVASGPGWSGSGAPWVEPRYGMKKLVWTETRIVGGGPFGGYLPKPSSTAGPFQDAPWVNPLPDKGGAQRYAPRLYEDVAVVAFPLPTGDVVLADQKPTVTSSSGPIESTLLWDGSYLNAVSLPFGDQKQPAWILVKFDRAQMVKSMTLALKSNTDFSPSYVAAKLQSSQDGIHFKRVATVQNSGDLEQTMSVSPTTARYFRLLLPTPPVVRVPTLFKDIAEQPQRGHHIFEFALHSTPRVDNFEAKAGFAIFNGESSVSPAPRSPVGAIDGTRIVDLSAALQADGSLKWNVPPGRWVVLRIGYSLTGTLNHPVSGGASGLEVDKLSSEAVRTYINHYLDLYESMLGPELMGQRGLHAIVQDSWESGLQNWTKDLPREFMQRRGYSPQKWLPALTGWIINDTNQTEKFLWDFRRTLADLVTDSYYGEIAAAVHRRGMVQYGESHEIGRAFIGDGMDAKRNDDVPMGAMWETENLESIVTQQEGDADLRESASVAHICGRDIVAAESMTTIGVPGNAFAFSPERLKPTADLELADGVNRFIIHSSVHQPQTEEGPGLTLGPYGQWFTRNETWAEQASPWITYLARSSYLMQQGKAVADILYYYGQDSNITALYGAALPAIPRGYDFDFANPYALTLLSTHNGRLVADSGASYRLLVLSPRTSVMSLDVLKNIARLVSSGATVLGEKPTNTPSLSDDGAAFHMLANQLWEGGSTKIHHYGTGSVISGLSIADVLANANVRPDFDYSGADASVKIVFAHRRLGTDDLYFINNRSDRPEKIEGRFRIRGKLPEIWRADAGTIERASYRIEDDRTIVPLVLNARDALFLFFHGRVEQPERTVPEPRREVVDTITGPWQVRFQSRRGAPKQSTFSELKSWTSNSDPRIRFFSGTANYETTFTAPQLWFRNGERLEIDLGIVKDVAELVLNGRSVAVLWKQPYRIDVSKFLNVGKNSISVRVTNLWPNRLIGDKQPNAHPVANTTFNPYVSTSPLLESGLIGPVKVLKVH